MQRRYYQSTVERVRQLRLCLLVHSYVYYKLDTNIVSDHQWQSWADELVRMQSPRYPMIDCYDDAFRSWDASTGYHLPADEWVRSKAQYLLRLTGRLDSASLAAVTIVTPKPKRRSLFEE